ncbi:uncharacterized protein LOC110463775 [Mizuhopecten yessoensis]|uniref:uncharacterized protein LOC110463775 n=1 Tax=Mizuhopecten yessoensis TaxID=6573 RepID=UPI000B45A560|nr:uncharacterized protein LOC110463775 [Mizuhopecten yessoensis]XP_021374304.1 uncharacterized protein LOC110463775 [Mizuhopecten yessoensis]
MATSLRKGQIVVRAQGQTTCVYHKGNTLDWFCETCSDLICATCVSSTHKGHDIIQLSLLTPDNKRKIRNFIEKAEKNELNQIPKEIASSADKLQKHLVQFEKLAEEVKAQGEKLKEEINVLMNQTISHLKQLQEEHSKVLQNYKSQMEQKLKELQEQLKKCKEALQIGTDLQVFDTISRIPPQIALPTLQDLGTASFNPNRNPEEILKQAFGSGSIISCDQIQRHFRQGHAQGLGDGVVPAVPSARPVSLPTENESRQKVKTPPSIPVSPKCEFLPESKVLYEWDSPCRITSICPTVIDRAWTCDFVGDTVTHMTREGVVLQQIQSHTKVKDICLTIHSVWACSNKDSSVMELVSGTMLTRFKTDNPPKCIYVTKNGNVLVGMKNKITQFTQAGKPMVTSKSSPGKQLICSPRKISQCPVSANIVVIDRDLTVEGGSGRPHVLMMDRNLQNLSRLEFKDQHDPYDVTYDAFGYLIVADSDNCCLHLLSGAGHYLRVLHTDTDRALAVGVDRGGILWAVFRAKLVKRIQYIRK